MYRKSLHPVLLQDYDNATLSDASTRWQASSSSSKKRQKYKKLEKQNPNTTSDIVRPPASSTSKATGILLLQTTTKNSKEQSGYYSTYCPLMAHGGAVVADGWRVDDLGRMTPESG